MILVYHEHLFSERSNLNFNRDKRSTLDALTPMSDQDRSSPYNINTIPSRLVMRVKKNINWGNII